VFRELTKALSSTRCRFELALRSIGLTLQRLFADEDLNAHQCVILIAQIMQPRGAYLYSKPKQNPFWLIVCRCVSSLSLTMGGQSDKAIKTGRRRPTIVSWQEIDAASHQLGRRYPLLCCRQNGRIPSVLPLLGTSIGVFGLLAPAVFLLGVSILMLACFFLLIGLRAWLYLLGAGETREREDSRDRLVESAEINWPRYTVLVPLFREAESVPGLVAALNGLDYPADKLEILFLTEYADADTRDALLDEPLHPGAQILTLPNGQPRTKPRALNVALGRLTGEFSTIYDAEDRPHPTQLKRAVLALQAGGKGLACVQAPLFAYNAGGSWMAGQWALEYDVHFGLILPALARLGVPIALGGTSNHFRVSALRCAGGWDAWNVTEDADIGLRFARMGLRVDVIGAPTQEEAPETLPIWIRQRSRWIKGYMQTWIVLMRQPMRAAREMGWGKFLTSYWLLSGAIGSALVHLPCLIWVMLCALSPDAAFTKFGAAVMIAGYLASAMSAFLAPGGLSGQRLRLVASFWLYWPLLSLAAAIAFYELLCAPHSWAKTPHALTSHTPMSDQEVFA